METRTIPAIIILWIRSMPRRRVLIMVLATGAMLVVVGTILYARLAIPEHPTAVHSTEGAP